MREEMVARQSNDYGPGPLGPDYLRFIAALGDALLALDRPVIRDVFGAYERMHEAAAMGPMPWAGKLNQVAFTCSNNPATLTTGDLNTDALRRTLGGLARNLGGRDRRFTLWKYTDDVLRGARRIYAYGLQRNIETVSAQLEQLRDDQGSDGLQKASDLRSLLAELTREYAGEVIALDLNDKAVA